MSSQEEAFNLVKENSTFTNKNINTNSRWKNFIDAVYVIHMEDDTINEINLNLKSQDLDDIVIYFKSAPLKNVNQNYFTNPYNLSLAGCHISHTLCAEHALENNYNYILILEEDCCFNKYITDTEINKLIQLRNNYDPLMINLGPPDDMNFTNRPEFNIVREPSPLTHFIYLNKEGMNKILNTKTCPPPTKVLHDRQPNRSINERYFGADDFWMCFTEQYTLEIPDASALACQYNPNGRSRNLGSKTNFINYNKL